MSGSAKVLRIQRDAENWAAAALKAAMPCSCWPLGRSVLYAAMAHAAVFAIAPGEPSGDPCATRADLSRAFALGWLAREDLAKEDA